MSRILKLATFAILSICSSRAFADSGMSQTYSVNEQSRWALGLTVGAPTGLSAKHYFGGRDAFDLNLDAVYGPGFRVGADYLWGIADLMSRSTATSLDVYLGAGPFVGTLDGPCEGFGNWRQSCNGDAYVGARMPIGLEAVLKQAPISLGLEVAPGLAIAPGRAGFLLDASLVLRVLL